MYHLHIGIDTPTLILIVFTFSLIHILDMSFIKIIISRGPRTDPCGTPYLLIFLDDRVLSIRVIIFLFSR